MNFYQRITHYKFFVLFDYAVDPTITTAFNQSKFFKIIESKWKISCMIGIINEMFYSFKMKVCVDGIHCCNVNFSIRDSSAIYWIILEWRAVNLHVGTNTKRPNEKKTEKYLDKDPILSLCQKYVRIS